MEIKQLVIAELKNIKKQAAELGLCAIELTSGSMEKRLGLNARTQEHQRFNVQPKNYTHNSRNHGIHPIGWAYRGHCIKIRSAPSL